MDVRKVMLSSIGLGGLLIVANIFLVMIPLWNRWTELNDKYFELKNRIKKTGVKVASGELVVYLKRLKDKLNRIEDQIVSNLDITFVMEDISTMARDAGLELKQILPKETEPVKDKSAKELAYTKIVFLGRGGYHQVGRFVATLENSKYVCKVTKIEIIPNPKDYRKNDVSVMVSVLTRKD